MISNKERVANARVWRKRYGAGMRQIGILAAAGHFALDNNIADLAVDHAYAQKIAQAVNQVSPELIDPNTVHTNIVAINCAPLTEFAATINASLKESGLLASALGKHFLRLVTHRDLTAVDIDETCAIVTKVLSSYIPK
jgi:threonine aldolase